MHGDMGRKAAVSAMEEEAAYVRGMRMGAKLVLELLKE